MRRHLTALAFAMLVVAGCSDDPDVATGSDMADLLQSATSTSTTSTSTTSTTTTVPPAPTSTSTITSTTTTEPLGMCGELIPVVTDTGTQCLTPQQAEWGVDVDPFWEGEMPSLVVASEDGSVVRLTPDDPINTAGFDASSMGHIDGWVTDLHAGSDGTLVIERHAGGEEYWPEVLIRRPDGSETVVADAVYVYDVTMVDGEDVALVSGIPYGRLEIDDLLMVVPLDDPDVALFDLGLATDESIELEHAELRRDTVVRSGRRDGAEFIDVEINGVRAPLVPYEGATDAPTIVAAGLNPDGTKVTWAVAPGSSTEPGLADAWVIRSMDVATGAVGLVWPIPDPSEPHDVVTVASIHDLGHVIVVNRTGWIGESWVAFPALIIDFTVEEPGMIELPIAGLAVPLPSGS